MQNKIQLFHGGLGYVNTPDLGYSSIYADFGPGFYTTTDKNQAKEWGYKKMQQNPNARTFSVSEYMFIGSSDISIKIFDKPDAEWMEMICNGRNGLRAPFDLVIGPVADSRIYRLVGELEEELKRIRFQDFKQLSEDRKKLFEEYSRKAMAPSFEKFNQSVFITDKALSHLVYIDGRTYDKDKRLLRTDRKGLVQKTRKKDLGRSM